eukprot:gene6181-8512_t
MGRFLNSVVFIVIFNTGINALTFSPTKKLNECTAILCATSRVHGSMVQAKPNINLVKSNDGEYIIEVVPIKKNIFGLIFSIVQNIRKIAAMMMIFSTIVLPFFININSANAVVPTKYSTFEEIWKIVDENFVDNTYNNHDWAKVHDDYTRRLNNGANEEEIIKNMLGLLGDKYTRLLDKSLFESIWKFDAIGVGLLFQTDPGKQMVVSSPPITGSAGEKAGIRKGDIIFSINGEDTAKMTALQLLDKMSNDNSKQVTIEYGTPAITDNGEAFFTSKQKVTLNRSTQQAVNPVTYYSQKVPYRGKNGDTLVGYIKLSEFNSEAVKGLKNALNDLNRQKVDELVLDLRGNTGGGFQFALNIGGMFMNDKEMVTALGKGSEKNVFKTSYPDGVIYEKPIVTITDGLSASASEVLVSGLHDNCHAVVTGSKTFGKGKIQAVFGLSDGKGLTMTVAQYITPKGYIIQSKGIEPDIPSPENTYANLLLGPAITKPKLSNIDFDKVHEVISQCKSP